jgi:hypothetical protein
MSSKISFFLILVSVVLCTFGVNAQEYHGTTGLLQVPSAETEAAGTFRGGITWVDKRMLPDMSYYGDGIPFNAPCYTIGITAFRWIQLSYSGTLVKMHRNGLKEEPLGYYNEDRHVNIKLNPLYEGLWCPAIAIGWDDIGSLKSLKINSSLTANSFFENLYIAATKHFYIKGYELGAHLAYRYYSSDVNRDRRGLAGGLTLRPSFYPPLRLIAEWDGIGINAGADVLLWRHLFIQAALIHGRGFTGGIGYHYTIPF